MPLANTTQRYGSLAKTLHWLTMLLIFTLIPLGIVANNLGYDTAELLARKAWLFSLHKTLGITLLAVALLRIGWTLTQEKPGSLNPDRRLEHFAAETVHWLLYGSLIIVPLSGWIHHAATEGFAPIWWPFGQNLPFVPKDAWVADIFGGLHIIFERVLVASIFLHVAGALKHHVIDRDATLRRMWFGKPDLPAIAPHHSSALPFLGALGAWAAALVIGSTIGVFDSHNAEAPQVELASVASDWQVQGGQIAITVNQFGSDVQGSFADWTAAISFDPEITEGVAGTVDVTIAIPSLTLGSVTEQALGADYFDAGSFPTARFVADLNVAGGAYVADGTLTIRDKSLPLSMPFDLTLEGDTAQVSAETSINRMEVSVGESMADESSLGFGVAVDIAVTATRNAE